MNPEERLQNWQLHDSIRGWFGRAIYEEMTKDDTIRIVTADLGYGLFDAHKEDFPNRFINVGASEQAAVGIGVGMALSGLKPFIYSITTFLIYRAYEWHRNFLEHENIPVMLIGSGYGKDYAHDGISHQPFEIHKVMDTLPNIETYFPDVKEVVPFTVQRMINRGKPAFMCLRR